VSEAELHDDIFAAPINQALMHQALVRQLTNARLGTHKAKTRGEVSGGGRKPWRQKGTGRARAGMASSPIWRGGGKIFPNSPEENFSQKVNRKMYRAGLSAILSQLARDGRLSVVDSFTVDMPKTKALAQKIKGMGFDNLLIITDSVDENLWLSSRNLHNVLVLEPHQADPVSLVHYRNVLVTKDAVKKFEEILA
jgi:large subunit ribosomal protein L4